MNKNQAKAIIEAHEIDKVFQNEEELKLLEDNNPELLDAYKALMEFAGMEDYL